MGSTVDKDVRHVPSNEQPRRHPHGVVARALGCTYHIHSI